MKLLDVPKITNKQRGILDLLYTHRFLSRIQIQSLLKHKDKKTINLWLKDLRAKAYINWIYDKNHFAEKTKPAIYYLGINGLRHLQNMDFHPSEQIRKRYREAERSQSFIDRCLAIADICIELEQARNEFDYPQTYYFYETEADYISNSFLHVDADSNLIHPQLRFSKLQYDLIEDPHPVESYLLEMFDASLPRYRLRNRLKKYVEYLDEEMDEWEQKTHGDPFPTVLLVCATLSDLIYAKRRTRGLLADIWEPKDNERPHLRFTTADKLRQFGVISKEIWEEA